MENLKVNFKKLNNIRIKINKKFFQMFLVSFLTVIITLGLMICIAWNNRSKIFNMIAFDYLREQQALKKSMNVATVAPDMKTKENDAVAASLPQAPSANKENTIVDAVKKANPAVVSIIITKEVPKYEISYDQNDQLFGGGLPNIFFQTPTYKQNGTEKKEVGSGSGFLVSADGYIVTNRHVVADTSASYEVYLNDGESYDAKVLARDSVLDVAIVKITPSFGTKLPYLELGDSDKLDVGQSVIAIGNALGEFKNTVSVGIVSGLSRSLVAGDGAGNSEQLSKVIQTDAAINPGNSGGPLLDLSGRVVGVNVAIVQGSQNVGFSLPINSIKTVIDSVRKTGKIIRPYIGVRFIPVTPELKSKNNLSVDYGVLVQRGANEGELAVVPGSPADKAGILENDIILEIDGQKIDVDNDLASLIRGKNVGDMITMKILSKGTTKTLTLRLDQAPDNG